MNKVIISGANGFLGNALVKRFVKEKIKIYALVLDLAKVDKQLLRNENIKWIEINADFINEIVNVIDDGEIDAYYHFAWLGSSGKLRSDYKTQINNIYNTCNAAITAKKINCKKFIFSESIMEYEIKKAIDLNDDVSINTLYSTSKLSAKYMAKTICQNIGIDYVGALISNVYGPGEKSERLINTTIRKLNAKNHCSFSSGEQLYDFVYIDDAIEMLKIIGEKGEKNNSYYIGNVKQRKLKDFIVDLCDAVTGTESLRSLLGFGELPNPTTILDYNEFDVNKISRLFQYEPKISFKEGIIKTIKSIQGEL